MTLQTISPPVRVDKWYFSNLYLIHIKHIQIEVIRIHIVIMNGHCSVAINLTGSDYSDVIVSAMGSQITSLKIVYWTIYSGTDQRKHQSSASLAFVWGIYRSPVKSSHKGPVTRKMFPFDDVDMRINLLVTEVSNMWTNTLYWCLSCFCLCTGQSWDIYRHYLHPTPSPCRHLLSYVFTKQLKDRNFLKTTIHKRPGERRGNDAVERLLLCCFSKICL